MEGDFEASASIGGRRKSKSDPFDGCVTADVKYLTAIPLSDLFPMLAPYLNAREFNMVQSSSDMLRGAAAVASYQRRVLPEERWDLWWAALHCDAVIRDTLIKNGSPHGLSYYFSKRKGGGVSGLSEEGIQGIVKRDVARTFQDWDRFRRPEGGDWTHGQNLLADLLLTLSGEEGVAYTQGMNYVAAAMLNVVLETVGEEWLSGRLSGGGKIAGETPDMDDLGNSTCYFCNLDH